MGIQNPIIGVDTDISLAVDMEDVVISGSNQLVQTVNDIQLFGSMETYSTYQVQPTLTAGALHGPYVFSSLTPGVSVDQSGFVGFGAGPTTGTILVSTQWVARSIQVTQAGSLTNLYSKFIPGTFGAACQSTILTPYAAAGLANANDPKGLVYVSEATSYGTMLWTRNSSCWAAGIDLTCVSPYNNDRGPRSPATAFMTTGQNRWALQCYHFDITESDTPLGQVFWFVDNANNTTTSTVKYTMNVPGTDFRLVLFTAPLASGITPAKILPGNHTNYWGLSSLPCMVLAPGVLMTESAYQPDPHYVSPMTVNWFACVGGGDFSWVEAWNNFGNVTVYLRTPVSGDSGSPLLTAISGQTILLTALTSFDSGNMGDSITAINATMATMWANAGESGNPPTIQPISLAAFPTVD